VDEHIAVQATFQTSGVDAGVSKTINMPGRATEEAISKAFMQAWRAGIKGMTIYRDGSRKVQALAASTVGGAVTGNNLPRGMVKHRPRATIGPKLKVQTACGALYIDTNFDADGLIEVFQRTVAGGCEANAKALGVLASYTLRLGLPPQKLIGTLKKIKCPACERAQAKGSRPVEVKSCADGMARAMEAALQNGAVFRKAAEVLTEKSLTRHLDTVKVSHYPGKHPCPECGTPMCPDAGCMLCLQCGFSKC
jgi:ribonucleoside-diphosphate reductase alpha chain